MEPQPHPAVIPEPTPPVIPDYTLLRLIGRGSYGDVWLARGLTGVLRAIKVIWRERFPDPAPFARELHGLQAFATLPLAEGAQLALLHAGQNEAAGYIFYVMELADDAERGRDIDPDRYVPQTLAEVRARRGRLPTDESVRLGVQLARELATLHAAGLVHRDIKPSNVIFVGGVPKLADIGLVAHTDEARTFVGTDGFVPPEGSGAPSADVFALGKVLYEVSTGLDRQHFPRLPSQLDRWPDRRAWLRLNDLLLRACDPRSGSRYRDGAALLADLLSLQGTPAVRRPPTLGVLASVLTVAVLAAATAWWHWRPPSASANPGGSGANADPDALIRLPAASVPAREKTILVLPLENLSPDPANAFFTEGMHAEIIATLSQNAELRVFSRESALHLASHRATLAERERQFGVGNVIAGNVRRTDRRLRVQLELRRTADEVLLWTKTFDRELRDSIALQSEIAEEVASVLRARACSDRRWLVPTRHPEAYERYLQGAPLLYQISSEPKSRFEAEIQHLEAALRLDPEFLAAAHGLSWRHALLYANYEPDAALKQRHAEEARRWAEKASQLMPGGGGDGALIYYCIIVAQENRRALRLAEKYLQVWPNEANAYNLVAMALTNLGRAAEADPWRVRAIALDPSNRFYRLNRIYLLAILRRKAAWESALAEYGAGTTADEQRHWVIYRSRFLLTGEVPGNLAEVPETPKWGTHDWLWTSRRWGEAAALLERKLAAPNLDDLTRFHLHGRQYDVARKLQRTAAADEAAARGLALAEKLRGLPEMDDSEKDGRMAQALAHAGRFEEAIAAGQRYCRHGKLTDGQWPLWVREVSLAHLYVEAGRRTEAIDLLARLLRVPSTLTVARLRVEPEWDPLRGLARFEALLSDPRCDAPL